MWSVIALGVILVKEGSACEGTLASSPRSRLCSDTDGMPRETVYVPPCIDLKKLPYNLAATELSFGIMSLFDTVRELP